MYSFFQILFRFNSRSFFMAEPATKKLCPSSRGKKDFAVHSQYDEVERGKLRCRLCYQKWFEESIVVAMPQRQNVEAHKSVMARIPPLQSVPSFAKAGTDTLRSHLVKIHGFQVEPISQPLPHLSRIAANSVSCARMPVSKLRHCWCLNSKMALLTRAQRSDMCSSVECHFFHGKRNFIRKV